MRRWLARWGWVVLLVAAAVTGWWWLPPLLSIVVDNPNRVEALTKVVQLILGLLGIAKLCVELLRILRSPPP